MRGHVQKKDGNWYVVLEMDRENGTRQQKWISVRKELNLNKKATKTQAEELLVVKLRELQQGIYFDPDTITLGDFLDRWLETYCQPNLRQKTFESYQDIIRLHVKPEIGKIPLEKLKPAHLQELYTHKLKKGRTDGSGGLSHRTVRYIHSILKEALSHAVKWEAAKRNIADAVDPPKPKQVKERVVWTEEEATKFLLVAKEHRLFPLFLLAISSGMRRGEIIGLRWSDVDLKKYSICISQSAVTVRGGLLFGKTKTDKSTRTIPIPKRVAAELQKHHLRQMEEYMALGIRDKDQLDLVFISERCTPLNPPNLIRIYKKLIRMANVSDISFHDLRHTYATLMLQTGIQMKVMQELLGHADWSTTANIYTHVIPDLKKNAAQKFEENFLGERTERSRTFRRKIQKVPGA